MPSVPAMARRILIIQHLDIEGPGTLGLFLAREGMARDIVRPDRGERIPASVGTASALVVLGGPMNVYEEQRYPYLKEEKALLRGAAQENVLVLGICLGAQLLACACGASVGKSLQPEIGWYPVGLNEEGQADPLFKGLPESFEVFQWHGDMFAVPRAGRLLAGSPACPHQAFRVGAHAYGLQFHLEVTPEMIGSWIGSYSSANERDADVRRMLSEAPDKPQTLAAHALTVYRNFAGMLSG